MAHGRQLFGQGYRRKLIGLRHDAAQAALLGHIDDRVQATYQLVVAAIHHEQVVLRGIGRIAHDNRALRGRLVAAQHLPVRHQLMIPVPDVDAVGVEEQVARRIGNRGGGFVGQHDAAADKGRRAAQKAQPGVVAKKPVLGFPLSIQRPVQQGQKQNETGS